MSFFYGRFTKKAIPGCAGGQRHTANAIRIFVLLLFTFSWQLSAHARCPEKDAVAYEHAALPWIYNNPPSSLIPPNIFGVTTIGSKLNFFNGLWYDSDGDVLTFTYQWYRADNISGANDLPVASDENNLYTLTMADAGKYVRIKVTANDGNGGISAAYSVWTLIPPSVLSITCVNANPTNTTTVNFKVTFSGPVESMFAMDFLLDMGGDLRNSISTYIGTPTTTNNIEWNVPVTGVTRDGTVKLNYTGGSGINSGVPAFYGGETYTIDRTPPDVPGAPDLLGGSDSGQSSTDDITNVAQPTFEGTAPANTIVRIFEGNNLIGEGTSNAAGHYSITTTNTIGEGSNLQITARTVDEVGNVSNASGALAITVDRTAPQVDYVNSVVYAATYKAGDGVPVLVRFNENVFTDGVPELALNIGSAVATYQSRSGVVLQFAYTVQNGDEEPRVDYASIDALTVNPGSITDAAGNVAILTLRAPGGGSLATNTMLRVDARAPAIPSAFSVAAANGENVLTWNANSESDLSYYEIYRGTSASNMTLLTSPSGTSTIYTDAGLVNGTTYYYKIRASDDVDNKSDWSSVVQGAPKQPQTITFTDFATNIKYGHADVDPGATASSGLDVTYESDDAAVATIVDGKVHILKAGTVTITAKQAGDATRLAATDVSKTLTIGTASLTIAANDATKTYGQTLIDATSSTAFTSSGLQNGETIGSVSLAYGAAAAATALRDTYNDQVTVSAATGGTFMAANYNITYVQGDIIVNPASVTVTANDVTKQYGEVLNSGDISGAFTSTGFQNGEYIDYLTINYGNAAAGTAIFGAYGDEVTATDAIGQFDARNYNITYRKGAIIVIPAPLTITVNNVTKTYGQTLNSATGVTTFTSSGLLHNETIGSVSVTYGTGAAANAAVGTHTGEVIASAATGGTFDAANYDITYANGNIVVGALPINIVALVASKTYGQTLTGGAGSTAFYCDGLVNGETIGSVTVAYGAAAASNAAAGSYLNQTTISAATGGTFVPSNYNITYLSNYISVNPAALTITANDVTKQYGQTLQNGEASAAFTSTGLQNDDTIAEVTLAYGNAGNATASAGTHIDEVTASAAAGGTFNSDNYNITYKKGDIIVSPAPLTITANNATKTYGQTLNNATGVTTFTSSGLQNNETIGSVSVTYGTGAAANAAAGTHTAAVTASAATGGTFDAANYDITYANGNIVIGALPINIVASAATKTYGQTLTGGPGSTAFYCNSLVNGETIGSVTVAYGAAAASNAAAGTYLNQTTISAATGGTFLPSNYNITYLSNYIFVDPAALTITANDVTKQYGQTLQNGATSTAFTSTGLQNGDIIDEVTLAYGNAGNATAPAGTYNDEVTASAATGGTFASDNYNITYKKGDVIVNPVSLTATAQAVTKVYNGTNTAAVNFNAFTTAHGLIAGDDVKLSYTSAAYDNKNTGTGKAITFTGLAISGADAANYTLSATAITGAITPKSVTAGLTGTVSKVYNATATATLSSANYTLNGIEGTDAVNLTNTGTATYDNQAVGTGKWIVVTDLALSGADAANYSLASTNASAAIGTITKKDITVSLHATPPITKVYDGTATGSANLVLNGVETADAGEVTVSGGTVTYDNKNTGTAKVVTATGFALAGSKMGNYQLTSGSATATGTIAQKELTIAADNKTTIQGLALPALTARYSGFIAGEDYTVLTTQPVITTTATAGSPQGNYPINVSGAAAQNYNITYVAGILAVTPGAPSGITLTANTVFENQPAGTLAGTFGTTSEDPAATFTYALVSGNGSTDNAHFSISGNELRTTSVLDFENKPVYSIRVRSTTQHGLSLDKEFTVTIGDVNEAPTLNAIADQNICLTTTQQAVVLSGITAGPDAGQTLSTSVRAANSGLFSSLTVTTPQNGNAQVRYTLAAGATGTTTVTVAVTDNGGTANGGVDNFTRSFTITVNAPSALTIVSSEGNTISKGATTILTAAGGVSYQWQSAAGIVDGQGTAALTVRPPETTTYRVTATNASGCQQAKEFTVEVKNDQQMVSGTNILTPNGDGKNDYLIIRNLDMFPGNELKIFDPAGRLIYRKMNYDNRWNGTLNGVPLAEGTYYYIISFGNGAESRKGFISIIRN